ncbi:hypothetical protein ACYULU_10895 [Breznakiellaceae bacterium SP9]
MNIKVLLMFMLKILFVQKIYTQKLPSIITNGTVEYFFMNYFEVNVSLSKIEKETGGHFFEKSHDFYEYLINEMISEEESNIEAIIKKYNK